MLLKLLLNLSDVTGQVAGGLDVFEGLYFKFHVFPGLANVVSQLILQLELFVCGVRDVFNVFTLVQKLDSKKVSQAEGLLIVGNFGLEQITDLKPVTLHDRWLGETSY